MDWKKQVSRQGQELTQSGTKFNIFLRIILQISVILVL